MTKPQAITVATLRALIEDMPDDMEVRICIDSGSPARATYKPALDACREPVDGRDVLLICD